VALWLPVKLASRSRLLRLNTLVKLTHKAEGGPRFDAPLFPERDYDSKCHGNIKKARTPVECSSLSHFDPTYLVRIVNRIGGNCPKN
jgi:hypothetical protein